MVAVKTDLRIFSQDDEHLRVSGQTVTNCEYSSKTQASVHECLLRRPSPMFQSDMQIIPSHIKKRTDFKMLTFKIIIRYQRLNGFEKKSNTKPK